MHFKVNATILPGVQNYRNERAAKHKLQMATRLNNPLLCQHAHCAVGFCDNSKRYPGALTIWQEISEIPDGR